MNKAANSGFKGQRGGDLKSKTGVSVAQQKGFISKSVIELETTHLLWKEGQYALFEVCQWLHN